MVVIQDYHHPSNVGQSNPCDPKYVIVKIGDIVSKAFVPRSDLINQWNSWAYYLNSCDYDLGELDFDHTDPDLWPELFPCNREAFTEGFYKEFPWAKGVDPFEDNADTSWRPIEEYFVFLRDSLPIDFEAHAPNVLGFVNDLISLELDELLDDERRCPICREIYGQGEHEEMPLELPCKHVVGENCQLRWFSNVSSLTDENDQSVCPTCRMKLVSEIRSPLTTLEDLEQLLRDANYLLTAEGPLTLTDTWRQRWERIKQYVNAYLDKARPNKERRQTRLRIFMRMLHEEICETVWNARDTETLEEAIDLRDNILDELQKQNKEGIIEAYLEKQACESGMNSDADWTIEELMTYLAAMPCGLGWLIQNTYHKRVTGGRSLPSYHTQRSTEPTDSTIAEAHNICIWDTKLKKARYDRFVDTVRDKIFGDSWCSYLPCSSAQEERMRYRLREVFENAQRSGSIAKWLEAADSDGPREDDSIDLSTRETARFVEYIVNRVYKTQFVY
ncbi:hypothetical protein ACLMJK_001899 [Lecanora helva]